MLCLGLLFSRLKSPSAFDLFLHCFLCVPLDRCQKVRLSPEIPHTPWTQFCSYLEVQVSGLSHLFHIQVTFTAAEVCRNDWWRWAEKSPVRNTESVTPVCFSPRSTRWELNRWELFMRCTAGSQTRGTALCAAEFHSLLTIVVRAGSVHSACCLTLPQRLQQTERHPPSPPPATCMVEPPMPSGRFGTECQASSQSANSGEGETPLSNECSETFVCLLQGRHLRCHDRKLRNVKEWTLMVSCMPIFI